MMTTNKLTKTFASGSLVIGVLAGSVLTATCASAMTLTWEEWTSGIALEAGDKIATYVSGDIGADPDDEVTLALIGDEYDFIYSALPGNNLVNSNSGSFTYTIEITDPNKYFTGVSLDSDVTSTYGTVTKFVEEPNITLTSVNGSADPLSGFEAILPPNVYQLLTVTDTLNPTPGEGLFTLDNGFQQSVPEPSTILGLLAVGGLGMVSRFKKQK